MSCDLLPCPFCGGEDVSCGAIRIHETAFVPWVQCDACHACVMGGAPDGQTEEQAIDNAASFWNRRAERTCRNLSSIGWKFTCSECHSSIRPGESNMPSYCPSCGAKVVVE